MLAGGCCYAIFFSCGSLLFVLGEQGNEKTSLHTQWATLGKKLRKLRKQLHKPQAALAFAFIEVSY